MSEGQAGVADRGASRRAVVVGGSYGIGAAIAKAWAQAGADVVVCSRTPPRDLASTHVRWQPLDIAEPEQARARLAELAEEPVAMVCYSAVDYGVRRAPLGEVAEEEWRHQLAVNATGLWMTVSALLPALRAHGTGLMLGVSSEVVINAGPARSGYAASKAAARSLLDSVAQEVDSEEVRVVQALPAGMVDTPGIRRRRPTGFDYSDYADASSFEPVARALAADAAPYHGSMLVVAPNGGWWSVDDAPPVSQSRRG